MSKMNTKRRAHARLHDVTNLLLAALIASCDYGTTGPVDTADPVQEVAPLLTVDGEIGAQFQKLTITREGAAVTDGMVTVNGVAIRHAGAGLYEGQLPTAVPPGAPLNLWVSAGGATVKATVNLPETPVPIAPATGAVFAFGDSITVSWSSATTPDRFVVSGAWVVDDVGFSKTFPAAGTARDLTIAAREFPAGLDVTISVFACNDGSFTGQADRASQLSVRGEDPPDAAVITIEVPPLWILGGLMWDGVGAQVLNIWIHHGGRNITDGVSSAVVTVNGVVIPHAGGYPAYYRGELPAPVPPGSPLEFRVSARGLIVEATANVPEAPVLTAPATGSAVALGGSITVRWTSATNPDRFVVYVNTNRPVWRRGLPGVAREVEIAASELPAGTDVAISVVAANDAALSGPAHPDSHLGVNTLGLPSAVITINP